MIKMPLKIDKDWFVDEEGRRVLLRGVNLVTKVPFKPNGATHIKTDFSDHRDVSFVGRPFPLNEAEEHYKRLKHWGFNCLRFSVTWEAIEHKGPKQYDKEYLDYIEEMIKIAGKYGFYIFIDPHQDVWSRMTGGDGAPAWTFEKVGLDFTKFDAADAASVMQYRYDPNDPEAYPEMSWASNKYRFANGTMWTLFFGGNRFAPSCKIDGINVQDYLQNHYIESIKQVALRVKDFPYVIGFDTLNEPEQGWIEQYVDGGGGEALTELGYVFTPIEAMLTGSGFTQSVGFREVKGTGVKETRRDEMNINKVSCWLEDSEDIWKKEGVWGLDDNGAPIILKNEHFVSRNGEKIDFYLDHLSPFIKKYAETMCSIIPYAIMFFEGPVMGLLRGEKGLNFDLPENVTHAPHWYDIATMGTKKAWIKGTLDVMRMRIVIGPKKVQRAFYRQLKAIRSLFKGKLPTLIGEFGLPYDLNRKVGYKKFKENPEKAWVKHITLLNMYYNAMDQNFLHSTQWNYTFDNSNEWGDLWNTEDFSIFSKDQQLELKDINSGGRAIKGFCRPHIKHCAGEPLKMEFNIDDGTFIFDFEADLSIKAPTILYIPKIQYPNGFKINLSEGEYETKEEDQFVLIKVKEAGFHGINITRIEE
jgi:hypothetical protein